MNTLSDLQLSHDIEAVLDLSAVAEYFDARADVVDGDYGIPEPNEEMRLGMIVSAAIIAFGHLKGAKA